MSAFSRNKIRTPFSNKIFKLKTFDRLSEDQIINISLNLKIERINEDNRDDILNKISERGEGLCQGDITKAYIDSVIERTDNPEGFLILFRRSRTIGFMLYEKITKKKWHVILICVNKELRRKTEEGRRTEKVLPGVPVGRIAMKEIERLAHKNGVNTLIGESVPKQLDFYLSLGWEKNGRFNKDEGTQPIKRKLPFRFGME